MKTKLAVVSFFIGAIFINASCHKDTGEAPHNHSLLKKSLSEIKAEIAGRWKIKYGITCGFAGCLPSYPVPGQELIVNFLPLDTVKQTNYNEQTIYIYEKASISKQYSYRYNDSVYTYSLQGGFYLWTMQEIKNDTLVITEDLQTAYLVRY